MTDMERQGVIPLGPIDDRVLEDIRCIALAASMHDWAWSHSGTQTHEDAIAYVADMLRHSDRTDLQMVGFEDDGGEWLTVALTGNGPTSEANAAFIASAQPINIVRLIDEIRRLRA